MNKILILTSLLTLCLFNVWAQKTLHDFKVTTLEGEPYNLAQLKGKKVLIVNTASRCGFTKQYDALEKLYNKYKDKNFIIIGFPSNNFGRQEPGTAEEIREFCTVNFGITFPLMEKTNVKGRDIHPLYQWLTQKEKNGKLDAPVRWNFQKYLVDEMGTLVNYFAPGVSPNSTKIIQWIEGD